MDWWMLTVVMAQPSKELETTSSGLVDCHFNLHSLSIPNYVCEVS